MKMNKSILVGMTALSLFATSAAAATSAVTPVISNAAAKKTEAKRYYKFNWLFEVRSKGHATRYYNTVKKLYKASSWMKYGFSITDNKTPGYSQRNQVTGYTLWHNKIVRTTGVHVLTNIKHKAIKDSVFVNHGTYRISKAQFNKLSKEQTAKFTLKN